MKVYRQPLDVARGHAAQQDMFKPAKSASSAQPTEDPYELVSFALPWSFFTDECKEVLFEGYARQMRHVYAWAERVWNHFTYSGFTSYHSPSGFNAVSARLCCVSLIYGRFYHHVLGNHFFDADSLIKYAADVLPLIQGELRLYEAELHVLVEEEYPEVAARLESVYRDTAELYEAMRWTIRSHSNLFASLEELADRERRGIGDDELYWNDLQALGWLADGMPMY